MTEPAGEKASLFEVALASAALVRSLLALLAETGLLRDDEIDLLFRRAMEEVAATHHPRARQGVLSVLAYLREGVPKAGDSTR